MICCLTHLAKTNRWRKKKGKRKKKENVNVDSRRNRNVPTTPNHGKAEYISADWWPIDPVANGLAALYSLVYYTALLRLYWLAGLVYVHDRLHYSLFCGRRFCVRVVVQVWLAPQVTAFPFWRFVMPHTPKCRHPCKYNSWALSSRQPAIDRLAAVFFTTFYRLYFLHPSTSAAGLVVATKSRPHERRGHWSSMMIGRWLLFATAGAVVVFTRLVWTRCFSPGTRQQTLAQLGRISRRLFPIFLVFTHVQNERPNSFQK